MHTAQDFRFDRIRLRALADDLREQYATARPFPHVVVDDFLPPEVLDRVLEEFPAPEQGDWQRYDDAAQIKLALSDTDQMGPSIRHLLAEFNGQVFVDFLERLTGIDALIPDPHLLGGGLHQIRKGGLLKVHADFNRHERLRLDRRLNCLLYLNKDWQEEWGGHLQLWNKDMTACERKALPVFNRLLVFSTTDDANHGHPDPLDCPPDRARRSMALYYYSNGRPEQEVSSDHTTLFKERPRETWRDSPRQALKRTLKPWVPPAVFELTKGLRRR